MAGESCGSINFPMKQQLQQLQQQQQQQQQQQIAPFLHPLQPFLSSIPQRTAKNPSH